MISVTEYLELPAEIRRKTDLIPKPRGRYRSREVRKKWRSDPEGMLEYLREHHLDSAGKIVKHRKMVNRNAPTVDDLVHAYGSWKNAQNAAFGAPIHDPFKPEPTPSPMYLITTALRYNLRNREAWCEARKTDDLVPSIAAVRRQFGTFTRMKLCARMLSIEWGLEAYMKLAKRKGRLLTVREMMSNGINLTEILSAHGTLADRNWLLRRLMKIAEQRKSVMDEWDFFPRDIAASEAPQNT